VWNLTNFELNPLKHIFTHDQAMMLNTKIKQNLLVKWIFPVLATCLLVFVAAEQFNLIRTDSISAITCTKELFSKPTETEILDQNKNTILLEAGNYDLPPELLAVIIYSHQRQLTTYRGFTDCAGSAISADLSLGLAQIRISTAISNDGLDYDSITHATFKKYRAALLDPHQNIRYQASELRHLLERDNRFPGITSGELIKNPFAMTLLMSEYRAGRQTATSNESRLSGNAIHDLRHMLGNDIYLFSRNSTDIIQIQNEIREFLEYIYCDRGTFNSGVCEDWHTSLLNNAGIIQRE
jgi:hypothetical protein